MSQSKRNAEESQLLAEERWITEALQKIRNQRNCLQIERLQLESMLAQKKYGLPKDLATSHINLNTTSQSILANGQKDSQMEFASIFDAANVESNSTELLDSGVCNFEKLDLNVNNPAFDLNAPFNLQLEYDEEIDDSDNEENMSIDMNMFMNSDQNSKL